MSSFSSRLDGLEYPREYARQGCAFKRWGQLLREDPGIRRFLQQAVESERLVRLGSLATIHGGVVTRANAYFIVRALPFSEIPPRFHLTRNDYRRVTVVVDGLGAPMRMEKTFLRPIVKGPEALLSPSELGESDARLFVVDVDKSTLREDRANGALAYIRRGETVPYQVSDDDLKGGIPAQRSNIRNRKPYWYSLKVPAATGTRLCVPEHLDRRYVATLIDSGNDSVVIDKLYTLLPNGGEDAEFLLASLNSLLTWYQIELRGRTQLGQGVLELKVPDWQGILVANPKKTGKDRRSLLKAFRPLRTQRSEESLADAGLPQRLAFDSLYLKALGCEDPEDFRLLVERELRAANAERRQRRQSVAAAKIERKKSLDVSSTIDAYAARLAAKLEPFPDPRRLVPAGTPTLPISLLTKVDSPVTVGSDLFTQSEVHCGDTVIANTPDKFSAQFVRGVLLHDPEIGVVEVPRENTLRAIIKSWEREIGDWRQQFDLGASEVLRNITDDRIKSAIRSRAMTMLHAQ